MTNARPIILMLVAAGVVLFTCDPVSTAIYPGCPFHWVTGLYCPVCGSLRGMHALLHGHVPDAARCNALTLGALCYGAAIALRNKLSTVPPVLLSRPRAALLFAIAAGFTVVRNLPGDIGALLRP